MKKIVEKHPVLPSLLLVVAILMSCVPAAGTGQPELPLPTPSDTVDSFTPTASQTQTETSTFTASPTATQTFTPAVVPSVTQPLIPLPSATVRPARTRTTNRQNTLTVTDTFTATLEPTVTGPASASPTATLCPVGTPEPLWVEPVTSPTDQLSQTIIVRIGNGEEVNVLTESGTFTATGDFNAYSNPALVEVTLLPNTVHHLQVSARVRTITMGGCLYGGYTLTTTNDTQGAPLTIVQGPSVP
jgi:hypothetical protein